MPSLKFSISPCVIVQEETTETLLQTYSQIASISPDEETKNGDYEELLVTDISNFIDKVFEDESTYPETLINVEYFESQIKIFAINLDAFPTFEEEYENDGIPLCGITEFIESDEYYETVNLIQSAILQYFEQLTNTSRWEGNTFIDFQSTAQLYKCDEEEEEIDGK